MVAGEQYSRHEFGEAASERQKTMNKYREKPEQPNDVEAARPLSA
jgi:hypothetical protein